MKKSLSLVKALLCPLTTILICSGIMAQQPTIHNFRPYDKNGVNVFETPKDREAEFEGLKVRVGGNFTQQFQALDHENAPFIDTAGMVLNSLYNLKPGFNLATANLNIDVQLEQGISLNMVTYLSSRHHPEAWVKSGFIQFDALPFIESESVSSLMDKLTIKVGHMEVNYGDAHFRRTDNGNAIYNPFVGNFIIDAFNTEIGGEVYYKGSNIIAMLGLTGGEINGNISDLDPNDAGNSETDDKLTRSPSILGKLAYDSQINEDMRLRISGSTYYTASSAVNHILDGDRGGSRYYLVMVAPGVRAGDRGVFPSGRYNPSFSDEVTLFMGNIFLKYQGLELFALAEFGKGKNSSELDSRNFTQFGADLLYRIGANENAFIGGRYNTVKADDISGSEVTINRFQLGAGWFITKNILAKVEYVNQEYKDFPAISMLAEGKFNGVMFEASVGF